MADEGFKRKLAAILSADVEGYSRLMDDDEEATVRTLTSYRNAITDLVQQFRGRVVDAPGDNLLAEFTSVVDAVNCAVEIQRDLAERNTELAYNRQMQFRIGVNLGDVIEEDGRIYGDGVNIAARVESLAEAGGICISGRAFDQVENKLGLEYENLGEHQVKNITRPIRVYRVLSYPGAAAHRVVQAKQTLGRRWRKIAISAAVVVVITVGLGIWQFYGRRPAIEPASVEKMAFPLPDKPSIAVLPFENLSGDPKQDYFSDGLTDQIINTLSKIRNLFVIARNSTYRYKGQTVEIHRIAEDLGVKYVLEGSVQRTAERIRVTAQLIDATRGHQVWSERYDREQKDIFEIQDDITMEITNSIGIQLLEGEHARISQNIQTSNLGAYEKILQGRYYFFKQNKKDSARARLYFKEASALDPNFARPYLGLGWIHFQDVRYGWVESPKESIKMAYEFAQKAINLDENLDDAHLLLGSIYILQRQHDKAIEIIERAVANSPNSAPFNAFLGGWLGLAGRWQEGIRYAEMSIRLSPYPPSWYFWILGRAYYMTGQYEKAIEPFKKAVSVNPDFLIAHAFLAACYSSLGRQAEAATEADEVLRINPKFTLEAYAKTLPYKNKADIDRYIIALRNAGLPDTPPLPLPDKPSIAVLAFDNLSGDPEQEYFSDGIAVEIINGLVRWPSIVIIPKSSSFIYKGKTVDIKQVGREMGVRYVLEGSVRRQGNRVRVTVQLVDVITLKHLFSERYEREMKDIFAIQDEITMGVLTAMRVSLSGTGVPSLRGKPTKSIEAYLKLLQAEEFISMNRDTQARAKRLAEEAISLDPEYARAYALMAATIGNEVLLGVYNNPQEALERAIELSERAIQLDDSENMAHRVRGFLALLNKDYEKAIAGARRALELAPNSVMAQMLLGYCLYSAGRTEEAIPILEKAVALNPIPSPRALSHLGIAYRKARRYEEAVVVCRKLIQIKPNYIYPHLTLAATFAEMDKMEEARAEIREVLRINPKYTVKLVPRSFPWKDQTELDRLANSLHKAGLPE